MKQKVKAWFILIELLTIQGYNHLLSNFWDVECKACATVLNTTDPKFSVQQQG